MSQEAVWNDIQKIVETKSTEFRVRMDRNVHCMDVGIAALKASDPTISYSEKEKLHRLFRKEFFLSASLEEALFHCRDDSNIDRCLFVEDPIWGDYIIAPSYSTLRTRTSNALKSSKLDTVFTGTDKETGKTTTNIGHLSLKDSRAATTPLESKLLSLLEALQQAPIASSLVNSKIVKLQRSHKVGTSYNFVRPNFDSDKFQSILGTATVLVTLQTAAKNKALAKLEASIELELRKYLTTDKFKRQILNQKGSNSILEDLVLAFGKKYTGSKSPIPGSKHTPKPSNKKDTSIVSGRTTASTVPSTKQKPTSNSSLVALQILLDKHLQDVISANMGDQGYAGGQRKTLNYRTGRFAASAKVARLSQSREGMITAFYTYMKNPYQTFEPGFRQGSPKTRDPKLLIAGSIREIAATLVGNRMRAVSI